MEECGSENLSEFLNKFGLTSTKWLKRFKDENITKVDQIRELKSKEFAYIALSLDATPVEAAALREIFEIKVPTDSTPVGLDRELSDVGLDVSYWSEIFEKQLSIKSPEALQHVGEESYQILAQFVNKPWERRALRKLLKMESEESSFQKQREAQKEKLKNRLAECAKLLQNLKTLQKKGKGRQDILAQIIEQRMRERVQIPLDVWVQDDVDLGQVIAQMETVHGEMLKSKNDVSDRTVIEKASSGLALRGVFITKDPNDATILKHNLLKLPEYISLDGPSHSQHESIPQFFCKNKEKEFKKRLQNLGYSAATSAKGGFWGASFEASAGFSRSEEEEETNEHHREEKYCSTVKYCVIPMASCSFRDHHLQLSKDALAHLQKINKILLANATNSIQVECEGFFQKFGSHACIGPLHFGGTFRWKSFSSGFTESERSMLKELQSEAITLQVGASYGGIAGVSTSGSVTNMRGKFMGNYSQDLISKTQVKVNAIGGPKTTSLPEWKNGLIASNASWALIDRGTEGMAVWDIVEMNHSKNFPNCTQFVQRMKRAWQNLNKSADSQPMTLTREFEDIMDGISHWNKNPDPNQYETQLIALVEQKERAVKQFLNPQVWATQYLSQQPMQQYLQSVVDFCLKGSSEDSSSLKRCLRQLLDPIDLDTARIFPNQQYVVKWLYNTKNSIPIIDCQDFLSLHSTFKLALDFMQSGMLPHGTKRMVAVPPPDCSIRATKVVARAVLSLRHYLQKSGQKYEDMFVTTMLYPFKYHVTKHHFDDLMGLSDLKFLCGKLETEAMQFFIIQKKSLLRLQAYLFSLTVVLYDELDVSEPHVRKYIKYLEENMADEMKPELLKILNGLRLNDPEYDWDRFKSELDPLVQGTLIKPEAGDELLNVLANEGDNVEHILHTAEKPRASLNQHEEIKQDLSVDEKKTDHTSHAVKKPHPILEKSEQMKQFFMRLNLIDEFPQMLSLSDALVVREDTLEVFKEHQANEADKHRSVSAKVQSLCCNDPQIYPFLILQKIMAFDHHCRIELKRKGSNDEESDSDDDDDDDNIHPMDGLLALLHCADNILRQDLMNRLAICQLAIPLLLPDPITHEPTFLLWGMRSIIKEFRNFDSTSFYAGPIVGYQAPIISFLRFGRHSISKSKVLNAVIGVSKHDTFFHYDCAGGRATKVLLNGVVEVGWYLPSKTDGRFSDAVTFLNLRGNASDHCKQIQFLSKVSCMHFVFLKEEDLSGSILPVLEQLCKAPEGIVVLQTESSPNFEQRMTQLIPEGKFSIIKLYSKNEDKMKVSIEKKIKGKLKVTHTLEECRDIANECDILIDEDEVNCKSGRKLAQKFLTHIEEFKRSHPGASPKELLALQSKALWHKYGEMDKEQYRQTAKGRLSTYEYAGKQVDKMKHIRRQQLEHCQTLSPLMKSFLQSLMNNSRNVVWYYLQWLKIYLDDLSRELLPPLHSEYQKKRKELNDIQMQGNKDEKKESICRSEMNDLNMQLINASFGPEHMFREIGQMYEAVTSQSDAPALLRSRISRLPLIAAQLLVNGFPLELMDGDAAHIPIMWVSSVLDNLSIIINQRKTGPSNPQVFVLSVLGLQSTGKSTLMNTLFGVQFSVSAGRCTRGAFMQLLPVHSSLQKRSKYQYILIIDTEGLRAPELDALKMQKHDNELATFVIGIANLTIVNIKGEISGDMDDVLQTTVHAFLRMNKVKLTPSCHFAYQNVPAVMVYDNAMQGRFKIKDKLDAMTKQAAERAGLAHIHYFSQVITFDYVKDVTFFPDLWTGSPPMGHVSEFYSIEAQSLKHCIMKEMKRKRDNSVNQLKQHLQALWKAILHENFVFSFRNTFEIAAYTKLEEVYGEWSWEFKKVMDKWEQTARNELTSCIMDDLPSEYQRKKSQLSDKVKAVSRNLKTKMDKYFNDSPEQETIAKWKVVMEDDLKHLEIKLERHATHTCDKLFTARKGRAKAESKIKSLGSDIMEHVQQVASGLKKGGLTISDEELRHKFAECWVQWLTDLIPHIEQLIPPDIKGEMENSIREHPALKEHHQILVPKLTQHDFRTRKPRQWGLHLRLNISTNHITRSWKGVFYRKAVESFIHQAQERTATVFTEVEKWLTTKRSSGVDFKPIYTSEVLEILFEKINSNPPDQYQFTPEYLVDMALITGGYAQRVFEKMSEAYCRENDPLMYIHTELKEQCWKLFKDNYEEIAKEKTAAETLCTQLVSPIQIQVLSQLESVVTEQMREEYRWLKTKKRFRAKVLHDIGENLERDHQQGSDVNFSECALHLTNPKQSFEYWIKKYTMEFCNDGDPPRISTIATKELLYLVQLVKRGAQEVTDLFSDTSQATKTQSECHINDWLTEFHTRLKGTLPLDLSKLCVFGNDVTLRNVDFFRREIVTGIENLHTELTDEFKNFTASVWDDHQLEIKPYDTLFEDIAGCTEQCPFCKEQCEYTKATHPESVLHSAKHRPQCLGGYRWEKDNTMILDVCTFLVASEKNFRNKDTKQKYWHYSKYSKFYPKWDIPKERSLEASAFWIWLVGNFSKYIKAYFNYSETEVYSHWKSMKWEEVKQMLEKEYKEV